MCRAVAASSAAVGSSSSSSSGSRVSARASATRARSPPDSSLAGRSRKLGVEAGVAQRLDESLGVRGGRRGETVGDVLAHAAGQHHGRLADEADASAQRARVERRRVLAVEQDRSAVRHVQPVEAAQQRALAGARGADERDDGALRRVERDGAEHGALAPRDAQAAHGEAVDPVGGRLGHRGER